jgi:hypothetical protein
VQREGTKHAVILRAAIRACRSNRWSGHVLRRIAAPWFAPFASGIVGQNLLSISELA